MINVYSFQKMISSQDSSQAKNISKTSHFTFGQNYKKIVSNSKGSFDFRKFLQKNHHNKKLLASKQDSKRNPLEQVQTIQNNIQSNLHNKAFKIRCYTKKTAKQNDKNQEEMIMSKFIRHRTKFNELKERKNQSTIKKQNAQNGKIIKMHKFDNYQELQSISSNIRIQYNDSVAQTNHHTDKAIIFDLNYIISCIKSSTLKSSQKQRQSQYHTKKIIYLLKRIIDQKYFQFPIMQKTSSYKNSQIPQIIFKVQTEQQADGLMREFEQCDFTNYYCVFWVQNKFVQSIQVYDLMKIKDIAQNIVLVDQSQKIIKNIPLLNSRHFISFLSFSQKCNFPITLQNTFNSLDNLDIRFSAEQFSDQQKCLGLIYDIPTKQLIEKIKQKQILKNCRKTSRQKKQRCQSSYQSSYMTTQLKRQQRTLQNFKQKMLKYIKIRQNQNKLESKKSKQFTSINSQQFQCMTGREHNSKTNYQVISELIRLNSHIHKQISNYQKKVLHVQIDQVDQSHQIEYLRFQKFYINILS